MAHVHPIAAAWAALLPAGVVARPALPNNLQLPTKADLGRANKYYNQVQMYARESRSPYQIPMHVRVQISDLGLIVLKNDELRYHPPYAPSH